MASCTEHTRTKGNSTGPDDPAATISMKIIPLQSGSKGNCVFVETGGKRLLFDAGISGKQAQLRLNKAGYDINTVDALLISHDHYDHASCLGVYQRKFNMPVYVTEPTLEAAQRKKPQGELSDIRYFISGETIDIGDIRVETIRTAHDGQDGVVFVIDDGRSRVGIFTDLGHVFDGLADVIAELDAVMLESNYDPHMLDTGPYPMSLKRRVAGNGGHISNEQSANLLNSAASGKMKWVCLSHLSDENNTPELAYETHNRILGGKMPIHVASRNAAVAAMKA